MERSRENQAVRKPQQKRSKLMAEKILDTALALFCEKGYYNTTTNQIAREAGISIGSLYSYFKDKDTVFLEILTQYHQNFLTVFDRIKSEINQSIYGQDKKEWLRILLNDLIALHLSVKTLNRELKSLYYIKEEVKTVMDEQTEKIRAAAWEFFIQHPRQLQGGNGRVIAPPGNGDGFKIETPIPECDSLKATAPMSQCDSLKPQTPMSECDSLKLQTPMPQCDSLKPQTPMSGEDDLKALVLLAVDLISSIVDRVVFDDRLTDSEKQRLVDVGVDAIYKISYE